MMAIDMSEDGPTRKKFTGLWLVAAAAVLILVLGDLNRRMEEARRLERDVQVLQGQVTDIEQEKIELQTQLAEATGEAYVAEWAHENPKMVREGEYLVVPVPVPGGETAPALQPTPAEPAPSPWEVWMALIFGLEP